MDEHFQVFEYIQWKFGAVPTAQMPWELPARMRPWLHISLFYPLEWISRHFLDLSPFTRATVHRACAAALALFTIRRLTLRDPKQLLLFATLFFVPWLDVRTSAEMLGGWLLALGFVLDDDTRTDARDHRARLIAIGFVFGAAVVIRLMVAAMVSGLLLFHARQRDWQRIVLLGTGVVLAAAVGVLCDRWGYGEFTCVAWNYVHQNLVLGKAVHFGSAPFYAYVPMLLEATGYLPGAVLLMALLVHWARRPLDKLTFMSAPFVLLHVCISHKELRFLFPLAPMMPAMLLSSWELLARFAWSSALARAYLGLNLALALIGAFHDANLYVGLYAALFEHAPPKRALLYYEFRTDPLRPWTLRPTYYIERLALISRRVPRRRKAWHGLVVVEKLADYHALQDEHRCAVLTTRYPAGVMNAWPQWLPETHAPWLALWSLWRCP